MTTLKSLNGLTKLGEKISVYVPSTVQVNQKIDASSFVEFAQVKMSHMFGGCTAQKVSGAWVSAKNGLVIEDVTIVYSYTDAINNEQIDSILAFCEYLKKEMSQECISLEINGSLYFV